ncbi:hypothetical protein [Sphingobacterium litopenaei]|uniref:Uncharacterized protein n=1 Tax=Sphingobacterium litopenaei TaxID=2763500 RepID=A0ABR7YEL4_9SPHI|nr:hypothetical protein [Sphingobacterium litopenaei]MBD1429750.1 hypothetical protein [Sphingobacterium litopenaei]
MRGLILLLGIIILGINNLLAQPSVRINIVLNHVQNLTINPDQQVVNLNYNTLDDYRTGVEVTKNAHLSVFSTTPYEVKVKLANNEFVKLGSEDEDRVSMPDIQVSPVSTTQNSDVEFSTSILTTEGRKIISSSVPTTSAVYNIQYKGPKGENIIRFAERNKTIVFYNDVLYSIETK